MAPRRRALLLAAACARGAVARHKKHHARYASCAGDCTCAACCDADLEPAACRACVAEKCPREVIGASGVGRAGDPPRSARPAACWPADASPVPGAERRRGRAEIAGPGLVCRPSRTIEPTPRPRRRGCRTDIPRTSRGAAAPWIFRGRREPSWGRFATTTPAVLVFVPCRGDAAAATRIVLGRHERRRRRSEAPRIIENGLRRYWLNLDGVRPAHNPPLFLHIAKTAGSMVRGCLPHHCDGDAESRLRGCLPAGRERARPDGLCQSRFLRGKPDRSVGPVPSFATQVALARADPRVFGSMAQSDAGGLADVLRRPPSALSPRGESADWVAAPPRRAARTFPRGRASRPRRGYFLWR